MSEQYDVIVIGGGIAGLSTVANITEGNVLLIEKDKIKTEENRYMRFTFLESANRLGLSNAIINHYDKLSFISITGSRLDVNFDDFELGLIDLGKLNRILKKRVEEKHEIRENTEALDVNMDNNKINILISDKRNIRTISSKYLVDASGYEFLTRKKFKLKYPSIFSHTMDSTFKGGYKDFPNILTFILPSNQFKSGGWIYPFNDKNFSYGIADTVDNVDLQFNILLTTFNETIKKPFIMNLINDLYQSEIELGITPIGFAKPLLFGKICYIGDVIGQVTPWMIEGIRPISEASILCTNAINNALKNRNKSLLNKYQELWFLTYGELYKSYPHMEKWNRSLNDWENTLKKMSKIAEHDKKYFIEFLMYNKMSSEGKEYLRTLKSQIAE